MKIVQVSSTDEDDYREGFKIYVNDKKMLSFVDGEPEDTNLARNFSDCYSIIDLVESAYEAGKRGEILEIENKEVSWEVF